MIGRTLGRYQVEARLGQGGLATVWKARDTLLGRAVALKILDEALCAQPNARRRFLHEARSASLLDHPGVVAVFDAGEADGRVYIALSLIDGATVAELAAGRLMPIPEAVRIVSAAAEALDHAHARGVIHRDVTARNIMVARDGRVFVLDFGLALALGTSRLTTSGATMGTAAYMAPEMVHGEEADARSDLYGLGVVLYESLTGALPFAGDRPQAMIYAALNQPPRPLRERRPEIPEALERIVLRAIARQPGARYASAAEMLSALRAVDLSAPAPVEAGAGRADAPPAPVPASGASRPDPLFLAVRRFERAGSGADPERAVETLAARLPATLCSAFAGSAIRMIAPTDVNGVPESDAPGLARALGANALLRGSVARSGSLLRVTWSVEDPRGGAPLAGGRVDGSAFAPFDLEDELVTAVGRALDVARAAAAATPAARPRDPAATERFAQVLGYLKRYDNQASVDGAIRLLEQLLASEGETAVLQATLACACIARYQLTRERTWEARAANACERARQLDAEAPEVQLALGDLDRVAGRHAEAEAHYRRALERRPELAEARLGLAGVFTTSGRAAEAEAVCREAITRQPDDWRGYSRLGFLYFTQGQYGRALDPWRRVVELTPDNPKGHRNVGTLFYHLDRFDEAVAAYRESLRIHPNAVAYSNLGTALFYLARYDQAALAFRKATELTPADPLAWGNLGNAYHWMPGHDADAAAALDRAIALMRERLERNPGDPEAWARLAGWFANRGCEREAREALRNALEPAPGNVECMVRAGYVHFQLGDRDESLRWFREAVRRGYGVEELRRSPDLEPLRNDPEFQRILEQGPAHAGAVHAVEPDKGGAA